MIEQSVIKAMRDDGKGYGEIAKELNVTKAMIVYYCHKWDLKGPRKSIYSDGIATMKWLKLAGLEYISGEVNTKANVVVKNLQCGHVYQINVRTVYQKAKGYEGITLHCPVCEENARKQKEEAEVFKRYQREWAYEHKPVRARQIQITTCKRCGGAFIGTSKYCSKECMNRAQNSRKEAARRIREKEQMIDKDISLERLYERDNGKCYMCGIKCNWDDKTITENGTIVVGPTYPTIEHVVPLSKGGNHSWDNVKLACFMCNTKKSDKTYPLVS